MGKTEMSNGAFGKSDIEGKATMVVASELGSERVSNGREPMSQRGAANKFQKLKCGKLRSKRPTLNVQRSMEEAEREDGKQLERFRPEPTEYCRCQHRVNQTIEKMLARDYPASAAPNRFLSVGCPVS